MFRIANKKRNKVQKNAALPCRAAPKLTLESGHYATFGQKEYYNLLPIKTPLNMLSNRSTLTLSFLLNRATSFMYALWRSDMLHLRSKGKHLTAFSRLVNLFHLLPFMSFSISSRPFISKYSLRSVVSKGGFRYAGTFLMPLNSASIANNTL